MVVKTRKLMNRLLGLLGGLLLIMLGSFTPMAAQETDFTDDPSAFVGELETFLKKSERKELKDLFKEFEKRVRSGVISPELLLEIREQAMLMRDRIALL